MYLLAEENERRLAAYQATGSDREAAGLLGIKPSTFYAWRCRRGLPNRSGPRTVPSSEQRRRMTVYRESTSDAEAAEKLGLTESGFRAWRQGRNLPAHGPSAPLGITDEDFYDAWKRSATDAEAAGLLDCSPAAVNRWRIANGVPARNGAREPNQVIGRSEAHRRKWQAYCLSTSAEEAAEMIGITPSSMTRWMRRMDLPPHFHRRAVRKLVLEAAERGDPIALQACEKRRWRRSKAHASAASLGTERHAV